MNTPSNPHFGLAPSPWIAHFASLVPAGARVLDVACGYGRHALHFAARGAQVVAVDRDAAALATLARSPGIATCLADLEGEAWPFGDERFDAIVVSHYLHRPLLPKLRAALPEMACFCTRRSRSATKPTAGRPIRRSCCVRANCSSLRLRRRSH